MIFKSVCLMLVVFLGLGNSSVIRAIEQVGLYELNKLENPSSARGAYPINTTLCYDDLGCFSNTYPFNNTGGYLPMSPEELNIEFLLFTRKNRDEEQYLSFKDETTLTKSNYDKNLPLKLIIHGFSNTKETIWLHKLKDAILNAESANVIIVGWGNGAVFPNYFDAASNTRATGRATGMLVNQIRRVFDTKQRVHCIGHSLGAHTCGYASNTALVRFDRISGMDPAGPNFEKTNEVVRLDPEDADFVDAIHTNYGELLAGSFGILRPVGHVDFYPNGGKIQPACPGVWEILNMIMAGVPVDPTDEIGCSHERAYWLYIESIANPIPLMVGFKCISSEAFENGECHSCEHNQCAIMGYYSDYSHALGTVYISTRPQAPYGGDHYLFELFIGQLTAKTAGIVNIDFGKFKLNITKTDDNIIPLAVISRALVNDHEFESKTAILLTFFKKPKPLIGADVPKQFYLDKIRITNFLDRQQYSYCSRNVLAEDKKPVEMTLQRGDCKL